MPHMTWPHWAWLALGLGLAAVNPYWTSRAFRLKWKNEELNREIETLRAHGLAAEHLMHQAPESGWARSEGNGPHER